MNKVVIYQVLVRLFGNHNTSSVKNGTIAQNGCGRFNDITERALAEIKSLGATHIWLTGVIEHAKTTSYKQFGIDDYPPHLVKGNAGSPYAIVDYYDVDPDLAVDVPNRMAEFEALVARCHALGLKVFIDFVPNHLARAYKSDSKPKGIDDFGAHDDCSVAFSPTNNFYYLPGAEFVAPVSASPGFDGYSEVPAKVTGNDSLSPAPSINDWYETVKLNYGVDVFNNRSTHFDPLPDTWSKMLNVLLFWAAKGIDGFRVDMAEMVPVPFWHFAIGKVKEVYPNVLFLGEVYNPTLYHDFIVHGRFDWLYDKVGMYDTLREVVQGHRSIGNITQAYDAVAPFRKHMLYFLENHDEQRIASSFFAGDAFKGWPAFFVASTIGTNPLMVYFGQEVGVDGMDEEGFSGCDGRTTIFDYWAIGQFSAWTNGGAFDGSKLTDKQKLLRQQYRLLLNLITADPVFASGGFYDVMYANTNNPAFRTDKIYAFLRYTDEHVYLCVANFASEPWGGRLVLPEHAFNVTSLSINGFVNSPDLLGGGRRIACPFEVALNQGIGMKLEAYQTVVFRLK
jgi:glycosidase